MTGDPLPSPVPLAAARKWTWLATLALVVLSILVGRQVYSRLIAPGPPLNFDEAAHSLPGYYVMRDILRLDARALWIDTHIQTLWPPGFSYLQAPVLFLLGRTDESARLFAYIALVLAILMGCAIACAIRPDLAPLASFISGLIALSAPGWLALSGQALQEIPVALVAFAVFWCFLRAQRTQRLRWYGITSLALYFMFLTKYNYAAFALAAIGLVDLADRLRRAWSGERRAAAILARLRLDTFAALYLPFLAGLAVWFLGGTDVVSTATKWRDFSFFVSNEDSGYPFWSQENLLFYVRAAADWLMPHPLLALAALLGAGWAVARIRRPGVALLALYFAIGFVLATVHQLKSDRYIAPLFPALWLLAGLGAADVWRSLARRAAGDGPRRALAASFCALAVAGALASWLAWLPRLQPAWGGGIADGLRAASQRITAWQQPGRPVLIIGTFGELSPPLFEWRLRPQQAFADGNIQYNAPPGDGELIQRVQHWLDQNPGTQVTLIQVRQDAALYSTDDMRRKNAVYQDLAAAFAAATGYRLVDSAEFMEGGLSVKYYQPR